MRFEKIKDVFVISLFSKDLMKPKNKLKEFKKVFDDLEKQTN